MEQGHILEGAQGDCSFAGRGGMPLISCIMPTYGRPDYVAESVGLFLAQDYPARELLISNDCPGQILEIEHPAVRVFNREERFVNLGDKRNALIEMARGEFIAVWDDDDIYLPWRLSLSMAEIAANDLDFYCPSEFWAYWGEGSLHDNYCAPGWISHPAWVFRKTLWQSVGGYPAITMGEDAQFFGRINRYLGRKDDAAIESSRTARHDRSMILRGKSHYRHTSIAGGQNYPDTTSGRIAISPRPIADDLLRGYYEALADCRARTESRSARLGSDQAGLADMLRDDQNILYLDSLPLISGSVGYGELGLSGSLGYENKAVEIFGRTFRHSLSAHARSQLTFSLNEDFSCLRVLVALNDDVPDGRTSADFHVFGDGRLLGLAKNVLPGAYPRTITADVTGVRRIALTTDTARWPHCHTVWIDPVLWRDAKPASIAVSGTDCLGVVEYDGVAELPSAALCVATVASAGYEDWLDDMLGSLIANSLCADALVVVFVFDESARMRQIISKHGAHSIRCRARHTMNCSIKSILYSVARMIRADYFLCLDADVLVCGDLRRLIATLEVLPPGSVLIARDAMPLADLGAALKNLYGGEPADLERITGEKIGSELEFPLVVNDGVFCASRPALNAIDDAIREMTGAAQWLRENPSIPWRNQFVFNLALARLNCGVEMDAMFNVQLNHRHIEFSIDRGRMSCRDNSRIAKIVHFNGAGRNKYADLRGRYQTNGGSHCGTTDGDSYGVFASALRRWVGYGGVDRLAWSFYGTADGRSARIADPTTFPLLALLHYLVRANGCVRVLETGTARGVSAACLASAVCHREGGKIVTLDPTHWPDRDQLWSQLPESMSRTIEPRLADSISGLQSAAAAGEAYDAALLDSIHSCEHVMKEFDLATRLVCTGGLILIHDATWKNGTVADALQRIQDRGYGVARLWTAESGIHEDDRLGLAVVENRLADASTKANSQFEAW